MQLIEALRYSQNSVMAFVGAGGKTTALFKAARELSAIPEPEMTNNTVLVTTTTHLGLWQVRLADHIIHVNSKSDLRNLEMRLPFGVVILIGEEENNRLTGMSSRLLEEIRCLAEKHQLPLLIEADGSGSRPLKAPATHEPAIPEFSQYVVVVAGLSGLGKHLTSDWVHRPEIFAELSGLNPGDEITIEAMVNVLRSREGGLKNIPLLARKVLLLNQADTAAIREQGRVLSEHLKSEYRTTVISSLNKNNVDTTGMIAPTENLGEIHAVIEQIAGIVLAAGQSSRFGEPKQLLVWKGQPIIRYVIMAATKAGLDPIVVVVGSSGEEIKKVISDLPVRIVENPEWINGVSSSIQVGMTALRSETGGVVFLQADQPQVSHGLITKLVQVHQETLGSIIAPLINGHQGNPVLFDEKVFTNLKLLKGDIGGRALFSQFPVQWITWQDPNQLFDIDTPEDYKKFLGLFTENEEEN